MTFCSPRTVKSRDGPREICSWNARRSRSGIPRDRACVGATLHAMTARERDQPALAHARALANVK